jgi:small subunit ribosomal protein S31
MELVCVGLSRNYWLTAEEKKDHIMWYKEYFSDKNSLLKEIGAGEILMQETNVNP